MNRIKYIQFYTSGFSNGDSFYPRVNVTFARNTNFHVYSRKPRNKWVLKVRALTRLVRFTNEIRALKEVVYGSTK